MGGTPDTWVTPDSDSSCSESATTDAPTGGKASHRRMQRPLPAEVSAAADSLQKLSLSGVTHVSGVPPIYLIQNILRIRDTKPTELNFSRHRKQNARDGVYTRQRTYNNTQHLCLRRSVTTTISKPSWLQ